MSLKNGPIGQLLKDTTSKQLVKQYLEENNEIRNSKI